MRQPNRQLAAARIAAGLTQEQLAELGNLEVERATGHLGALEADYLSKLERGMHTWPGKHYRQALCTVLGVADERDLGFYSTRGRLGTVRSDRPAKNAGTPPVDRSQFLRLTFSVGVGAVAGQSLAELITPTEPTHVPAAIGRTEIDEVLTAMRVFGASEHAHGGGVARQAVAAQLRYSAQLLNARCPEELEPDLYSAVGELGCTAGFMHFDAYAHQDAQRMFDFAVACAEKAEDWHLRAVVLSDMARQAFWLSDYDTSLTYVELAMVRSDRLTPTERAMLHTSRARALAKLSRTQEALTAIGKADEEFSNSNPANDPERIRWYNAAEHNGETGHALADLTEHSHATGDATARLSIAIDGFGDDYLRSRTFSQIKLATLTMDTADPHQAAAIGSQAVTAATAIRSHRISDTLRALRQTSAPYQNIPAVAELRHHISTVVT